MNCPYCNALMEKGELKSRGGVYFLPDGENAPLLYSKKEMEKHRAVYLPPYMLWFSDNFPTAYICRECKKIVVEYS